MKDSDFKTVHGKDAGKFLTKASSQIESCNLLPENILIRRAELPIYDSFKIYEVSDLRIPSADLYFFAADNDFENVIALDSTPESVYRLNRVSGIRISSENVVAYLNFFTGFVVGAAGAIVILENPDDVTWSGETAEESRHRVAELFSPASYTGTNSDGLLVVSACVFMDNAVLNVEIMVCPKEMDISMRMTGNIYHFETGQVLIGRAEHIAGDSSFNPDDEEDGDEEPDEDGIKDSYPEHFFGLYERLPLSDEIEYRNADVETKDLLVSLIPEETLPFSLNDETAECLVADLPFYKSIRLCAIKQLDAEVPNNRLMLFSDSKLFPLRFINEDIYEANEAGPIIVNEGMLKSYARFFFFCVRGKLGRFIVTENLDDIPWLDNAPEEQKHQVEKTIVPLSYKGLDSNGLYTLSGTVIFKDALFITDIKVAPQEMEVLDSDTDKIEVMTIGQLKLDNEDLLLEDLSVRVF